MKEHEAILNVINNKLIEDERMLEFYREKVAELEKENDELKLALMN